MSRGASKRSLPGERRSGGLHSETGQTDPLEDLNPIEPVLWGNSAYRPSLNIIEAAERIFGGHQGIPTVKDRVVQATGNQLGQTTPLACQDWTNTKAVYRFLSNGRVNETGILAGHLQAARERFKLAQGPILVLHDKTEFSYTRESTQPMGILHKSPPLGGRGQPLWMCRLPSASGTSRIAFSSSDWPIGFTPRLRQGP